MISGRRVCACVRVVKATARSDVGVVKHQGALETKCWSQEPKPKASAQNTVTRGKSGSFGAFAHVSNCEIQSSKTWTWLSTELGFQSNAVIRDAV